MPPIESEILKIKKAKNRCTGILPYLLRNRNMAIKTPCAVPINVIILSSFTFYNVALYCKYKLWMQSNQLVQ